MDDRWKAERERILASDLKEITRFIHELTQADAARAFVAVAAWIAQAHLSAVVAGQLTHEDAFKSMDDITTIVHLIYGSGRQESDLV